MMEKARQDLMNRTHTVSLGVQFVSELVVCSVYYT